VLTSARDNFSRYREQWNELNRSLGNHLLLDGNFVELLVHHFASPDVLLGVWNSAAEPAMLLVEPVKQGFWQTFQPSQAPIGLVLAHAHDMGRRIHALIRSLPGCALGLAIMQQDPDSSALTSLAEQTETLYYITTSRLTLRGTFQEYWKTRSHNLTH